MSLLSQIAYTGLNASQMAMTSAGQNIANVNTPGFSRVETLMASVGGQAGLTAGGGVQVSSIRRLTGEYQTQQLWRANTEMNDYRAAGEYLESLEIVMSGDGSSISSGLDQFFSSLSELTTAPESIALRQQVLSEARNLAQRFNGLGGAIDAQMRALHDQRSAMAVEINGVLDNIAELNRRIVDTDATNGDSKALRDHRENLVKELSGFASLRVNESADGALSVALANGQPLVSGGMAGTLEVEQLASGEQELRLAFGKSSFPLHQDGLGGALGGLRRAEYDALRPMLGALHEMAEALADGVNGEFAAGFDLDGNAGQPVFAYDPTSITGMLAVSDLAPSELAFSDQAGEVGNNKVLLALLELRSAQITVGGSNVTLNDAYAGLVGRIGSDSRQNQSDLRSATAVVDQAQAQRDRISAVNLDEEAVNLLNYQQAYQANMKVITTANQLFDSLLAAF